MTIKTPAIVLHSIKYGEADLIVKLYTKFSGLKSYLLRGVLKSKRGKIKVSLFQPLSIIEVEAVHKDKGNLERIKEAKILFPYKSLQIDFVKNTIVFFVAEILKNAIKEEEKNEPLYNYLETSFRWLDGQEDVANFHILFLIRLTQYLGFYPDTTNMTGTYFDLQEGVFVPESNNNLCIEGVIIDYLKVFLGTNFDRLTEIKLNKKFRADLLSFLLMYFEIHLQEFKKPKSLLVLNEIFK